MQRFASRSDGGSSQLLALVGFECEQDGDSDTGSCYIIVG